MELRPCLLICERTLKLSLVHAWPGLIRSAIWLDGAININYWARLLLPPLYWHKKERSLPQSSSSQHPRTPWSIQKVGYILNICFCLACLDNCAGLLRWNGHYAMICNLLKRLKYLIWPWHKLSFKNSKCFCGLVTLFKAGGSVFLWVCGSSWQSIEQCGAGRVGGWCTFAKILDLVKRVVMWRPVNSFQNQSAFPAIIFLFINFF